MKRLLKRGIPILVLTSLLVWLWFATRPQPRLSDEFMEGHYERCTGEYNIEFRGGRVHLIDQSRSPKEESFLRRIGRYELSGSRITVTWEKVVNGQWIIEISQLPKYEHLEEQEVLYYRKIGGVPVLLNELELSNFQSGRKIDVRNDGLYVFTTTPGRKGLVGWVGFLREHPEFAAAVDNWFGTRELTWWEFQRWRMRDALQWHFPKIYQALPEKLKHGDPRQLPRAAGVRRHSSLAIRPE